MLLSRKGPHMLSILCLTMLPFVAENSHAASPATLKGGTRKIKSLQDIDLTLEGQTELHITADENPINNCRFNLKSEDAWLFFDSIRPSEVAKTLLAQIMVNDTPAELNKNVRVVQYGEGTVVIPHPADFKPLEIFAERNCTGRSAKLSQYTQYKPKMMGDVGSQTRSFILKRGYMATFAENVDGTGLSKVYIAQDEDLRISRLPNHLDDHVLFVRVFPWRWTSKKGAANLTKGLNLSWWYNWNISESSTLDMEYVAIKQKRGWPSLNQDWRQLGATHLLGFNEPDKSDQANMSVDDAIKDWPELLGTGLRLGSPAVTDSAGQNVGIDWLLKFLNKAEDLDYRVDFVAVHYYRSFHNPGDAAGAAKQFYDYLKYVHDKTKLPIWVTEWNNGANWTDDRYDPSVRDQEKAIKAMVEMLDKADFVERYAIYNWVEDVRRVQQDDGSLTPAGEAYRDEPSPIGYQGD